VHIAELRKRAAEAEAKLKRLYDAIENGIADVSDPMLKERDHHRFRQHVDPVWIVQCQARDGAIDRAKNKIIFHGAPQGDPHLREPPKAQQTRRLKFRMPR
jgi:hypothetical protein